MKNQEHIELLEPKAIKKPYESPKLTNHGAVNEQTMNSTPTIATYDGTQYS